MPIDRQTWKRWFSIRTAPPWPCPYCNRSKLRLIEGAFAEQETKRSRIKQRLEDAHPMEIDTVWSGAYKCSECEEVVAACGVGGLEQDYTYDHEGKIDTEWSSIYRPLMLVPAPQVFIFPSKCPKTVQTELASAFSVFLSDASAAANHVRSAIEHLLTALGVKQFHAKSKTRLPISLHERILLFGRRNKDIADALLAIKWIGNAGSHKSETSLDDVLDAFGIFEVVLEDLFVGHRGEVRKIVSAINKVKGPIKKRAKKK